MSSAPSPKLISCVGVVRELPLLAHFVEHYAALGVAPAEMHIILNAEREDAPEIAAAKDLLAHYGTAEPLIWIAPYTSDTMWEQRRALQRSVAKSGDWVLSADVDEFHEYPALLPDVIAHAERAGTNVVQGVFIDRLAEDRTLQPVREAPSLAEQFPLQSFIMELIGGEESDRYGSVKVMLTRGDIMPSRGGHHPVGGQDVRFLAGGPLGAMPQLSDPETRLRFPFAVHHFKWTESLLPGLRKRLDTPGVSEAGKRYGARVIDAFQGTGIELSSVPAEKSVRRGAFWRTKMAAGRLRAKVRR